MFDKIPYLAFLAPFALFFQQGRAFLGNLFSFFVRTDTLEPVGSSNEFVAFLQTECREIRFGNIFYRNFYPWVNPLQADLPTLFVFRPKYFFLHKKFLPIFISFKSDLISCTYPNVFRFSELLKKYVAQYHEKQLQIALDKSAHKKGNGFQVKEFRGKTLKSSGKKNSGSTDVTTTTPTSSSNSEGAAGSQGSTGLNSIFYDFLSPTPPLGFEVKDVQAYASFTKKSKYYFSREGNYILDQVQNWLDAREWYNGRQIRWYRGCCLFGRPGLGKSALILEVARKLDMFVAIFDLHGMDNEEFSEAVYDLPNKSIVLFEDFDAVFDGRNNLCKSKFFEGLSFDCFLNKLSGVNAIKNSFVFVTTNHIEKIDPALLRDGRLDERIELKPLTREGKQFIAEKMLDLWPELIPKIVTDEEETPAMFENKVTQLALTQYWQEKRKSPPEHILIP